MIYKYSFGINIQFEEDGDNILTSSVSKDVKTIVLTSNEYDSMDEAMDEMNKIMKSIKNKLNKLGGKKYELVSEINPEMSGEENTIDQDWEEGEIVKLWVYDKEKKFDRFYPVAECRLMEQIKFENVTLH